MNILYKFFICEEMVEAIGEAVGSVLLIVVIFGVFCFLANGILKYFKK